MIQEDLLWRRIKLVPLGVPLNNKEQVKARISDISLTIPTIGFGEVGTFVITNQRFLFLMFQRSYAYEFSKFEEVASSQIFSYPNLQDIALIIVKTHSKTSFSLQGIQQSIIQINNLIVKIIQTTSPPVKTVAPKKIINIPTTSKKEDFKGLQGIVDKAQKDSKARAEKINDNIKDISSLMRAARTLKDIAKQLAEQVNKNDSEQVKSLDDIYLVIGESDKNESLVKKDRKSKHGSKGKPSKFDFDLANDFSNVMSSYFKLRKDISFLTPAECFVAYNKLQLTREGGDLISPKDLMRALDVIESEKESSKYKIGVEVLEYIHDDGSVTKSPIIVEKGKTFDTIATRLSSIKDGEYVTAFSLSKQLNVSEEIIQCYLRKAAMDNIVALDSSYAGDRYYKNLFPKFTPMKID